MERTTGIGGVFFRTEDPEHTSAWYREHLGIEPEAEHPSATMRWSGGETTVWGPFAADTDYFGSPDGEYGGFGWAVDCDGRRFELWQPPVGH